jgi:DNA-binding SARP family transcriptional activator
MEFRVLGPLEAEVGGQILPLRGRRQRALLALLLLSANEVVPDDRLLEDLWGDHPPTSGRAALRVRISQLRKALGEGGEALLTRPPGYALHAEPDRIDARLFERLYAEGRRQLTEDSAELAAMTLREALGLWPTSPTNRSPRRKSHGSRSFAGLHSRSRSTRTSTWAGTPSWSVSSSPWSPPSRCVSGSGAS